ncbi:MAG: flagellar export protein FliJ [Bacteroidia bacterium]|jgi:flagellar export protein FliJ
MANAFRFRLARVQRVRELHEEMARAAFSTALGAARQAGEYVDFLRGEIAAARTSMAQFQSVGAIDASTLIAKDKSVQSMLAMLGPARQRHEQLQMAAEIEREKWIERKADAQALEKLEKRHKDRHIAEVAQKENEQQDEVAIGRAFRRTKDEREEQKSMNAPTYPFRHFQGSPDRDSTGHSSAHSPL